MGCCFRTYRNVFRCCWGCAIIAVIGALASFLRPDGTTTTTAGSGARNAPAAVGVVVGPVEYVDPAVAAVIAAAVDAVDGISPKLSQDLYRLAKDDVLEIIDNGLETCDNWRKMPHQGCIDPSQCGKGWLFRRQGLLLAVVFPSGNGASAPRSGTAGSGADWTQPGELHEGRYEWHTGMSGMVNVIGLAEGGGGKVSECHSQDLSMLLRLQGPEALAEAAIPVTGRCAWTVQFKPTLEGVYTLDVTLLDWKGGLELDRSMCNEVVGGYGEGSVEMDKVTGKPFYGTFEACCTLCTREEGCVAWSATGDDSVARVNGSLCVLYSSVVGQPVEDTRLMKAIRSGTPRGEEAMMYLGPSMPINRSKWCTERNANVVGSGQQFTVTSAATAQDENNKEEQEKQQKVAAATILEVQGAALPLCSASSSTTSLPQDGRWIRLRDTKCDLNPETTEHSGWPKYDKDAFGVTMPEECFLKPLDKSAPHGEMKYAQGGHLWQPYDCRYDLMNTEARLSCFRDKNITRFLDFGDSLISTSRMARSALWLPTAGPLAWSTGKGSPQQIGEGAAEAGCVGGPIQYYGEAHHQHQNQPEEPGLSGRGTITNRYCGVESYWQNKPGQVRNLVSSFKPDVVLADWAIVHRLWHQTFEEVEVFLKQLGRQLDGMTEQDGHRPRHMFWLSAPFLVSEREPHCVLERALRFNKAFRGLLEPRGWIEIDWISMTQKWGLDTLDGMHHGEPPTRMLAYLLMHQVCHASE